MLAHCRGVVAAIPRLAKARELEKHSKRCVSDMCRVQLTFSQAVGSACQHTIIHISVAVLQSRQRQFRHLERAYVHKLCPSLVPSLQVPAQRHAGDQSHGASAAWLVLGTHQLFAGIAPLSAWLCHLLLSQPAVLRRSRRGSLSHAAPASVRAEPHGWWGVNGSRRSFFLWLILSSIPSFCLGRGAWHGVIEWHM